MVPTVEAPPEDGDGIVSKKLSSRSEACRYQCLHIRAGFWLKSLVYTCPLDRKFSLYVIALKRLTYRIILHFRYDKTGFLSEDQEIPGLCGTR
jgi:hypothetical protein